MKAQFKNVVPYKQDARNLPVADVETAIPYYEQRLGFGVVSRSDSPVRSVLLRRDLVEIGLAENGGDPSQEGCFFEVDSVEAAYEEIKGQPAPADAFRIDRFGKTSYRVFFEVAPDGLCYMLGERQE